MTDDLLTLARAIGAHAAGVSPAACTVWSAVPVGSRPGRAIQHHLNDLAYLEGELRDLHRQLTRQWQRPEREPPSPAAAAMIQHERRRDTARTSPLPPESRQALDDYLRERIKLMGRVGPLLGQPDVKQGRFTAKVLRRLTTLADKSARRAETVRDWLAEAAAAA